MSRRKFIKTGIAGIGTVLALPGMSYAKHVDQQDYARRSTELNADIIMDGLERPLKILQVSDSHISIHNDAEKEYEAYSQRMGNAYPTVLHYKTKERVTPLDGFAAMMELAKESRVDFIALTGDIVNYPSATAVEAVYRLLKGVNIPYLYTAGNHDWHYEGMPGTSDSLRAEWSEKGLKPLYHGNPLYSSTIINGINMVAIDNSTYQVNDEQLEFFRMQMRKSEPIALFVHIPIYMPNLKTSSCGHPDWGAETDKSYIIERRERWPASGNSESTTTFVQEVMSTEKLVGIFAGHFHRSTTLSYKNRHQYISGSGFNGQYRMIRLLPA